MFGRSSYQQSGEGVDISRADQQQGRENRHRRPPGAAAATGRSVVQTVSSGGLPSFLRRGSSSSISSSGRKNGNSGAGGNPDASPYSGGTNAVSRKSALRIALESSGKSRRHTDATSGGVEEPNHRSSWNGSACDSLAGIRRRRSSPTGTVDNSSPWGTTYEHHPAAEPLSPGLSSTVSDGSVRRPPSVRQRQGSLGLMNVRRRLSNTSCSGLDKAGVAGSEAGLSRQTKSNNNQVSSAASNGRGSLGSRSNNQAEDSAPTPSTVRQTSSTVRAASSPSGSPYLEPAFIPNGYGSRRGSSGSGVAADGDRRRRGGDDEAGGTSRQSLGGGSSARAERSSDSRDVRRGSGGGGNGCVRFAPSTAPSAIEVDRLPSIDRVNLDRVNLGPSVDGVAVSNLVSQPEIAEGTWESPRKSRGTLDSSPTAQQENPSLQRHSHDPGRGETPTGTAVNSSSGSALDGIRPEGGGPSFGGRNSSAAGRGGSPAVKSSRGSRDGGGGDQLNEGVREEVDRTRIGRTINARRSPSRLVGLQNLGNTCFMNACLQCLLHTDMLVDFFGREVHEKQLCRKSPTQGALAIAFGELVRQIAASPAYSSVSPAQVKRLISRHASHFSGYGQQDCQEFLRFLLDGLAEDLNRQESVAMAQAGGRGYIGSNTTTNGSPNSCSTAVRPPVPMTDEALSQLPADQQAARAWACYLSRNNSGVTNIFCGQLQSRICCLTCGNVSYCFDPFFDLSVPLPSVRKSSAYKGFHEAGGDGGDGGGASGNGQAGRNGNLESSGIGCRRQPSPECTLEHCLQAFTREEALDGDNRPMCSACKKRRKSVKSLAVHRFPPVLVVHLKRFHFDSVRREKIGTAVDFPISGLDLASYCTPKTCISSFTGGVAVSEDLHKGDGVLDGSVRGVRRASSVSTAERDAAVDEGSGGRGQETPWRDSHRKASVKPLPLYELYGVCNHIGSLEGGHYTAHCRDDGPHGDGSGSNGETLWNTFDDTRVSRINPARIGGSAAYVLFYRLQ